MNKLTSLLLLLLSLLSSATPISPPTPLLPHKHLECLAVIPASSLSLPPSDLNAAIDAALNTKDTTYELVTAHDCLALCSCDVKGKYFCKDPVGLVGKMEGGEMDGICLGADFNGDGKGDGKGGAEGEWRCACAADE